MTLSHPLLRALAVSLLLAFGVGCGGGASMMRPEVARSDVGTNQELEAATSCAGDVCFTYVDERE
jgi:hypothetical protein